MPNLRLRILIRKNKSRNNNFILSYERFQVDIFYHNLWFIKFSFNFLHLWQSVWHIQNRKWSLYSLLSDRTHNISLTSIQYLKLPVQPSEMLQSTNSELIKILWILSLHYQLILFVLSYGFLLYQLQYNYRSFIATPW